MMMCARKGIPPSPAPDHLLELSLLLTARSQLVQRLSVIMMTLKLPVSLLRPLLQMTHNNFALGHAPAVRQLLRFCHRVQAGTLGHPIGATPVGMGTMAGVGAAGAAATGAAAGAAGAGAGAGAPVTGAAPGGELAAVGGAGAAATTVTAGSARAPSPHAILVAAAAPPLTAASVPPAGASGSGGGTASLPLPVPPSLPVPLPVIQPEDAEEVKLGRRDRVASFSAAELSAIADAAAAMHAQGVWAQAETRAVTAAGTGAQTATQPAGEQAGHSTTAAQPAKHGRASWTGAAGSVS